MLAPTNADFAEPPCPHCGVPIPKPLRPCWTRKTCGAEACTKKQYAQQHYPANKRRRETARALGLCTRCHSARKRKRRLGDRRAPVYCARCANLLAGYRARHEAKKARLARAEYRVVEIAEVVIAAKRAIIDGPLPPTLEI